MNRRGRPIVLSAASGTGKTTIIKELMSRKPDLVFSVSSTTRKPRKGEVQGVHYNFISREEFQRGIKEGLFAEWEEVHGEFYGTNRSMLNETLETGEHVLLDLDVNGGERLKAGYPETILIFLYPPSREELRHRLITRDTETEDSLRRRLERYPMESEKGKKYTYRIMNDEVERATDEVLRIINSNGILEDL